MSLIKKINQVVILVGFLASSSTLAVARDSSEPVMGGLSYLLHSDLVSADRVSAARVDGFEPGMRHRAGGRFRTGFGCSGRTRCHGDIPSYSSSCPNALATGSGVCDASGSSKRSLSSVISKFSAQVSNSVGSLFDAVKSSVSKASGFCSARVSESASLQSLYKVSDYMWSISPDRMSVGNGIIDTAKFSFRLGFKFTAFASKALLCGSMAGAAWFWDNSYSAVEVYDIVTGKSSIFDSLSSKSL